MSLTIYDVVVYFFKVVLSTFFREIRPRGSHKIPEEGPVIFVAAPHANQFVDPLILMNNCQRRVSFLIAEKSMKRKYVGLMARAVHAIPVARPQDLAERGKGKIFLEDRVSDPTRITGIGTEFKKQLKVRGQIALPNDLGSSEITEIISDVELRVKKEFKDLKSLELLTQPEGTSYKFLPHVDQSQVYNAVFEMLNTGNCIGIFPEGGSHDRTEILPLKAGVAIMALGAMANNPKLDVKIVPCGLNYFHAHHFRSRAVVEFGSPISIPNELVERYRSGGTEKREACSKLLETIYNGLKSVTVNTPDYETLMVIQAARRLYKPEHSKLELTDVMVLNRRFVGGYMKFKDNPRVQEMNKNVMEYNQLLKYYGLRDHQVHKAAMGRFRALMLLIYRVFLLLILVILGFTGAILGLPIITIARVISKKKAREAARSSSVKIAGRDVLATWKLLVALGVAPILYGFYTLIFSVLVYKYNLSILKLGTFYPLVIFLMIVIDSYATLQLYDTGLDIYRSLRPLFLSVIPSEQSSIQKLIQIRDKLSRDLTELINELGPKLYPDFEASRIVKETRDSRDSRTPSPSRPSSRLLSLADWLDEKIFNWERADESDYDDVISFIDKQIRGRRSRRGSREHRSNSMSRSRASSVDSNNTSSSDKRSSFGVDTFTKLPSSENKNIPRVEVNDFDEDSGYQGDKEI
ncbi:996_t:CDS:2, partial [Acaulospora morrowiae]